MALVLCLLRPFKADNTYWVGRLYAWGVLKMAGIKVTVENPDYVDSIPESAVFISNHQNNFDIFIIGAFVPRHTVSVGKKIIKYFPFFGQIYWLSGNILIDRKKKKSALGTMNQAAQKIVTNKIRVWVMPEGTRSKGRGLLPFKKGAFHLAQQTKGPLIPICISNYHERLDINSLKTINVKVRYLEPIPASTFNSKDINQIKDETYLTFKSELSSLDERTAQLDSQL